MTCADLKVIFLTEGGSGIGFGHITRCLSLCQAFEEAGIAPEFLIRGDERAGDLLGRRKYQVVDWIEDRSMTFGAVEKADVAVIDSYMADPGFYQEISGIAHVSLYLDDNKRIDYPDGSILNGSINAEMLDYPPREVGEYLLGAGFVPLRKEFWDVPEKEIHDEVRSVLVTFGGDDTRNMTPSVLKLLSKDHPTLLKKVVIGRGFKNIREIERLEDGKTEFIFYPGASGMKEIMLGSDIAISAGGQTLYELARVGVPAIAVTIAENQMNNVQGWESLGFIFNAGWWHEEQMFENIKRGMQFLDSPEIRRERSEIGRRIVDGRGASRVARYCIRKHFKESISLRTAGLDDSALVYELSNEQEVRQLSLNQGAIALEEHEKWFPGKLKDQNCLFLIAESDGHFVGQVRFDISGHEAVVGISIDKSCRGFGMGSDILLKALQYLKMNRQELVTVSAYVKEGNLSSLNLFEKSGFTYNGFTVIKSQKALHYTYLYGKGA